MTIPNNLAVINSSDAADTVDSDAAAAAVPACRQARPATPRCLAERGMISAEWAVGIIAAIAMAGVLIAVITSGALEKSLLGIILTILQSIMKLVAQ